MNWYKKAQVENKKKIRETKINEELHKLEAELESQYPGLDLLMYFIHGSYIEVSKIKVPEEMRNQGIGTSVMQAIQNRANEIGVPVVLSPDPDPGKKQKLQDFYSGLGFVNNKGKNVDYELSSPMAPTMYWRPTNEAQSISTQQLYSDYSVIQSRPDLAPSMLNRVRRKKKKDELV